MATFSEWIQIYNYIDMCRRVGVLKKKDVKRIAKHLAKTINND